MLDLNHIVCFSLIILAFFCVFLFIVIVPIALQLSRTLSALQNLLDTLNHDLNPALKQINQGVTNAKEKISNIKVITLSSLYGLLAGMKDYFLSYKTTRTSYNNKGIEKKIEIYNKN